MSQPRGIDQKLATALPPAVDATDDDKGLYVLARYAAQNDHWVGFYKTWTKAVNFLIGEHWRTKWDGTTLTWHVERDIPPWHQQPVTNLVFAIYRASMAKLTKQKPTLEVVPASGESEDKEAADLSEALLTFLWRYLKKPTKLPRALGWMLVTGMSWFRVAWDPQGGERRPRTIPMLRPKAPLGDVPLGGAQGQEPDEEEVEVAADENGEPYKAQGSDDIDYEREPDMEAIGEITFDVVSPLAVRFNPEATSPDDAYEMYVGTLWPVRQAAKHFGLAEDDIKPSDESAETRALYEDLMTAAAGGFPRSWADQGSIWGVSQQSAIGDRALVIEYYHNVCDDYPKGRHFITVNGKKVWPPSTPEQAEKSQHDTSTDPDEFPNGEAELPFGFWPPLVPMFDTPIPGQPTALGILPQAVPLNEQLNVLDGKIAEKHVMDAMGGIWFVGPGDKGIVITSEPGQVIVSQEMGRRGAAYAPFQAQMKALPEAVYREREVMQQKIIAVTGVSGPDLAQKPQGTSSGRALLVTQETSDSVFMPTLFSMEAALEEVGRRELVIAQKKYTEPRMMAIRGDDGQWLFKSFTNADLRSGHDVRVQVGSSFPWSKAAQWDAKLSVITAIPQIVMKKDGTLDQQKFAKLIDAGTPGLGAFESDEDPDLVEVQREHAMFEVLDPMNPDGSHQVPQLGFWQNHAVHLEQHQNYMKKDFARFLKWSPVAQKAFLEHIQLTMLAVEQQVEGMMGGPTDAGGGAAGGGGGEQQPPGQEMPPTATTPGSPPPLSLVGGGKQMRLTPADTKDSLVSNG